ncbi:MFS transporter [Pseudonocardia sp. KRD291]|uniref:MFS transporter n=1 Tax=Pseudonocardia sp. KRD291 TaxID=2792007 RepID=UPI001C49D4B5|nr:MFS transporter [Pseudonocardia sp. KRD291]MBW0101999.1 MFS transporter [Pseudonocardia sp. KRD291]
MTAAPGTATPRGTRASLLLVGLLLIGANLRAGITAVGPVLENLRTDLGLASSTASALISVPLVAFALLSPVAPAVARRFGVERVLGASLALLAVAIVVRSAPWGVAALWAGTAGLGIAVAFLNVVLPVLVKRDHPDRIGAMTGLYSSVQSAAAAVAAGLAVPIAGTVQEGWRLSLGIWAGLALVGLAVFWPRMRHRAAVAPPLPVAGSAGAAVRPIWRSALAWQVTVFMGLQSTVYYTLITFLPSIEQAVGTSAAAAGWHQFVMQILSIGGALSAAALIQRLPDQRPLAAAYAVLCGLGVAGILAVPSLAVLWVATIGIGVGGGVVFALSLFGLRTRDHHRAGTLSGMAQCVGYLVAAAGPPAIGALHDATGSWTPPLLVVLAMLAVALVAGMLAGRNRTVV